MSLFAATLALLLGAQSLDPNDAGPRIGSRIDPATDKLNNADTSHMDSAIYRFVECAVARRGSRVKQLIDTRDESVFQSSRGALNNVQRCDVDAYVDHNATSMMFNADRATMRGFVAEALLKKEPKRIAALAPLPIERIYTRDWFAMTGRALPIDEMAACVADVDPQGIAALLRSDIGSRGQKAAVTAVLPAVGQCLSKTVQLKINPLGLRTALAEALYHRAFDAQPATGGAK